MINHIVAHVKDISPESDPYDIAVICSTESIDRADEIIDQSGWQLESFKTNPVFLAGHMYNLADGVSPVIGSFVDIEVRDNRLIGHIKFADTDLGREYKALYVGGHMRAVSVGFKSLARETRNADGKKVLVHTSCELFEVSAVAVPCNAEALSIRDGRAGNISDQITSLTKAVEALHTDLKDWRQKSAVTADRIASIYEKIDQGMVGDQASHNSADTSANDGQEPNMGQAPSDHLKDFCSTILS